MPAWKNPPEPAAVLVSRWFSNRNRASRSEMLVLESLPARGGIRDAVNDSMRPPLRIFLTLGIFLDGFQAASLGFHCARPVRNQNHS